MDVITQDIVTEALNDMEDEYKKWITSRMATESERELARNKIKQIEHARTILSKIMVPSS